MKLNLHSYSGRISSINLTIRHNVHKISYNKTETTTLLNRLHSHQGVSFSFFFQIFMYHVLVLPITSPVRVTIWWLHLPLLRPKILSRSSSLHLKSFHLLKKSTFFFSCIYLINVDVIGIFNSVLVVTFISIRVLLLVCSWPNNDNLLGSSNSIKIKINKAQNSTPVNDIISNSTCLQK